MSKDQMPFLKCLLVLGLFFCVSRPSAATTLENKNDSSENRSRIFSPRMDYDEWTPLGRGDPLKNDPTFDYVPPVLDRVQYWLDSYTTEASTKRDILVLGVTAKKTSPKIPEQFLKFVDAPKFNRNQETLFRNDFTGSAGAEPPKLLRTTNFRNNAVVYRNQNRIHSSNYYPSHYYNQKPKPYTIMLPPPIDQKHLSDSIQNNFESPSNDKFNFAEQSSPFSTQTEEGPTLQELQQYKNPSKSYSQQHQQLKIHSIHTLESKQPIVISQIETIKSYTPPQSSKQQYDATTPSVSFEKSNLIYQSTQTLSGGWLGSGSSPTPPLQQKQIQTWGTQSNNRDQYEVDHQLSASSNHEVVVGQNSNIFVDGESHNNEEVVVGHKEKSTLPENPSYLGQTISPLVATLNKEKDASFSDQISSLSELSSPSPFSVPGSSKMHIVVANSPSTLDLDKEKSSKSPVSVVMPMNYNEQTQNSSAVKNSNEAETLSNTIATVMTNMDKPMQIAKPQSFKSPVTTSPIMSTSLDNYENSLQPQYLNRLTTGQHSQLPFHQIMSSSGHQARPNFMSSHLKGNVRPMVPVLKPTAMGQHGSPRSTHMTKPIKNIMAPPPMHIDNMYQQLPSSQPQSTGFTDSPASTSTLTLHSIRVDDSNHHMRPIISDTTTFSSVTPLKASTSTATKKKFGDRTTKTRLAVSQMTNEDDYRTKTMTRPSMMTTSTTILPSVKTTTVSSLTTDPIFSHYKQPVKPIKGPMYLIIEGHSKVKTYKPTFNKHGVPIGSNELVDNTTTERVMSKLEQFINENTGAIMREKNLQENSIRMKFEISSREVQTKQENLLSLVENGLSAFTMP